MSEILSWDIGGANIKAARLRVANGMALSTKVASRPFEIWREKDRLPAVLCELSEGLFPTDSPDIVALTMTAELSDVFATKREGVVFVLESVRNSFPGSLIFALSLSGEFVPVAEALSRPPDFAATNWLASVLWMCRHLPNGLLVDVGGTTTDILPIIDRRPSVLGRTDTERLISGELVFTGALRTNLATIVRRVPIGGHWCRVASEYFAVSGDVHLLLGYLEPEDYSCSTPDGKDVSPDACRRRIARLVCGDSETLSVAEVESMARYIFSRQVAQICHGLDQVISRLPVLGQCPVAVVGSGAFLGKAAVEGMGLRLMDMRSIHNAGELKVFPCVAAGCLLAQQLGEAF